MKNQAECHFSWLVAILFAALSIFHPLTVKAQVSSGTITGTVTTVDTVPLASLAVGVYRADDESTRLKAVRTNTAGIFTLTGLPAGNYKIKFFTTGINYVGGWYKQNTSPPASAVATFGEGNIITLTSTAGADVGETRLDLGLQIKGKVNDTSSPSNPIAGVYVQAYRNGVWERTSDAATIIADGSYIISGLRAGDYTIRFWAYQTSYTTEWYSSTTPTNTVPDATSAASVAAGSININAQLSTGGNILGTVYDKTGTVPVVGALVTVYDNVSPYTFRGFTTTLATGTYTVRGLPLTGNYLVQFYEKYVNNVGTGLTEWYNDKSDRASAAADFGSVVVINQATGYIDNINATLDRGPISGKVTYKTGSPVVGMLISVYDSNQVLKLSTTTDTKGQYITGELPAGTYKVQFGTASWYNGKDNFNEANAVQAGAAGINAIIEQPTLLFHVYNILLMKKHCTAADCQ
ncbi:MAG: Carboxypeptidase regulatory-like domain-containing protein [Candidatus Electronema aureum]|uniref:Carboxypeptidase regulatory-like domain-containing protein n=1 Tax=Candidatus Electronema aureum TaxID=2005002 RepID=A0A521FZB8_9BACT|nr:MAG: Carboxypeptidase regulatory-like domain-containing protein [Candidatus Electronema aureum]